MVERVDGGWPFGVFAPHAVPHGLAVAIYRQPVLEEFFAIFQYILRDGTQVEVEVAPPRGTQRVVRERVHQPELDVLDVGLLEIADIHASGDASPPFFRVEEFSFAVDVGVEVVRASFVGVVGEVEHRYGGRLAVVHLPVGEYLPFQDFPHPVVR